MVFPTKPGTLTMTITIHISSVRIKYFISPILNAVDTNANNFPS